MKAVLDSKFRIYDSLFYRQKSVPVQNDKTAVLKRLS